MQVQGNLLTGKGAFHVRKRVNRKGKGIHGAGEGIVRAGEGRPSSSSSQNKLDF